MAANRDFFGTIARSDVYDDISALQDDFKKWRIAYNQAKLPGYPNYGVPPTKLLKLKD